MAHERSSLGLLLPLLLVPLSACSSDDPAAATADDSHHYFMKNEQPHAAEWGYEGASSPSHWGDLSPDYALAKTGHAQSPIDIASSTPAALEPLEFDYKDAKVNAVFNGHSIQENEDGTSSLTVGGKSYSLKQFHFHSKSEHTIDGRHSPMEAHFVHKAADGEVAVVGVMIEEGAENQALAPLWHCLPSDENRKVRAEAQIDVSMFLPADHSYFEYQGSFTTPPCTEGVRWFILREPVELSADQIAQFRAVIDGNFRPVQPLNGRAIRASE